MLKQICKMKKKPCIISSSITSSILTYYFPVLSTLIPRFYIYSDGVMVYMFLEP